MLRLLVAALASTVFGAAAHAEAAHPECANIIPPQKLPVGKRPLAPEDLVRLRDIGPVEPVYYAAPFFTASPDGRWVAFQLRQGDPQRNKYCLAMMIADLSRKERPRIIDEGGDPLLLTLNDFRGIADFPTGLMRVVTPRWSPDGKWMAF